jgi:hypothetical protein
MQLGKGPLRVHPIGFARLCRDLFIALAVFLARVLSAPCVLPNVRQVFQSNQGMGMLLNDLFGDAMVRLQFQPSLSLLDTLQASFRAASAFVLQAFAQSCVMVGSMSHPSPWMKARLARRSGGHGKTSGYPHPHRPLR